MTTSIIQTTEEAQKAAYDAAVKNYWDKYDCPDSPEWTRGKCVETEYYAKVAEVGAAEYVGYGWQNLCLYSPDPADYKVPDMGDWEIKAGKCFTTDDIKKGARYVLWVRPEETTEVYYCNSKKCGVKIHRRLSGLVTIRCWTDLSDLDACYITKRGRDGFITYSPKAEARRSLDTLPVFDWGNAA